MIDELIQIRKYIDQVIETYKDLHPDEEEETKETALKRIRKGYYEDKFRKSQRKEAPRPSQGQPALCVYGDS